MRFLCGCVICDPPHPSPLAESIVNIQHPHRTEIVK